MVELTHFQKAAAERIVKRLKARGGTRRFLLADEVGLGKTMVAQEVIKKLRKFQHGRGFTTVYICSNSEIAGQNLDKLFPEDAATPVPPRLTLLSMESSTIGERRREKKNQRFSFTPGTSLQVGGTTGVEKERRLLLYLVYRLWDKPIGRQKWREFFRCGASQENWSDRTRMSAMEEAFTRKVSIEFQHQLKQKWDSHRLQLLDTETKKERPASYLRDEIDDCVEAYDSGNRVTRKNRNRIIGGLRDGLAKTALDYLEVDLVILDEFQRFSEILDDSEDPNSVVGRLFARKKTFVLVMSATPYKMYTLSHEEEDHQGAFLGTMAFLQKKDMKVGDMRSLKTRLSQFRIRLLEGNWRNGVDHYLLGLKKQIEGELELVMCRTERNWYLEDAAKGVREVPEKTDKDTFPKQVELSEYIRLRHFLLKHQVADWNITDFWKSSSSILSFMDGQYSLVKQLRKNRHPIPEPLLIRGRKMDQAYRNNMKFRTFFSRVFDLHQPGTNEKVNRWKDLWVRPTYTYYRDRFYGQANPRKFLVFSHWRFVPKAVAILTSHELRRRARILHSKVESSPIRFAGKLAFYPFDACYPSPVLAKSVNQLAVAFQNCQEIEHQVTYREARKAIKELLAHSRIEETPSSNATFWQIVARIESRSHYASSVRQAMENTEVGRQGESEYYPPHRDKYLEWMEDQDTPLKITPRWLERLTMVALFSPAVCLLRSVWSVFEQEDDVLGHVYNLCVNQLRNYFNKPLVQGIIRRNSPEGSYSSKVLAYCRDAHFQAVLDEYAYLLQNVLQRRTPKEFLDHLGRALGMWTGTPQINERRKSGAISSSSRVTPTHFALAFGDEVGTESMDVDVRTRKSEVREAFNSPFWPFVLATTSVGQEGLDFHLYCQDIVHWNLPSNPVDMEQREGRINRYDGLCIRRSIRRDYELQDLKPETVNSRNLWAQLFESIKQHPKGMQRFKHGLFPHWMYRSLKDTGDGHETEMLRRHLLFYNGSSDITRYDNLKKSLALYRLLLGQPRQQDILERLLTDCRESDMKEIGRELSTYMINLSPISRGFALRRAQEEAKAIVGSPDRIRPFIEELQQAVQRGYGDQIADMKDEINALMETAKGKDGRGNVAVEDQVKALSALIYLLNPYDDVYDFYKRIGLEDDVRLIRRMYNEVFKVPSPPGAKPR